MSTVLGGRLRAAAAARRVELQRAGDAVARE
jgi:hypothetical protein